MRPAILALLVACAGPEPDAVALGGELGFEVAGALALVCPPDAQGQFVKLFVEGLGSAEACLEQGGRPMPLTCEARRDYLLSDLDVCRGEPASPGENLPLLDLLLEEVSGEWQSFDYGVHTRCEEGEDVVRELFGPVGVHTANGETRLSLDLATEGGSLGLSGDVPVEVCPL